MDWDAISDVANRFYIQPSTNICYHCNKHLMIDDETGKFMECQTCSNSVCEPSKNMIPTPQMRVSGKDSRKYQSILYMNDNRNNKINAQNAVYNQIFKLYTEYAAENKINIPLHIFREVSVEYNNIITSNGITMRGAGRRGIITRLLYDKCLKNKDAIVDKSIIMKMMKVKSNFTVSEMRVRELSLNGKSNYEFTTMDDKMMAMINGALLKLPIADDLKTKISRCIYDIIEYCDNEGIGMDKILKSKIHATCYIVCKRVGVDYSWMEHGCKKNTIKSFVVTLANFHSRIKPIYDRYKISNELISTVE